MCEESRLLELGVLVTYMALEYWLGKTERVKAGSTIELVVWIVLMVGALAFYGRKAHGRSKKHEGTEGTH